ncbi:P-loop containing nucleoside triphosphate hydrolase protein [Crassisporium funariophilum]|nr:P-loop containing nucleoside triphosphate hydrolase protein [Crassisporium funariophilum]
MALSASRPYARLSHIPTLSEIRETTQRKFGVRPCLWQFKVVEAILRGDKDVVSIAGTGMGKTLTFWMPLLFCAPGSIQVVVTPLNILGKQNVESLEMAGFKAISISANSATAHNFQAIENFKYQAVIISPEQMTKSEGGFERLTKNSSFTERIISTIFDEAHTIRAWGGFCPEYREVGRLRYMLPKGIPFLITTATMPEVVLDDVKEVLQLRMDNLLMFHRSSDRPNIHIVVRPICNPLNSFLDLTFLLHTWKPGRAPPPKFLVFFDDIQESIKACQFLKSLLPPEYRDKIQWFNSDMSDEFKEHETRRLLEGDSWGLFTTDSFGMGMDIPDIKVVVQWRATCSLSALWQRFGRGACNRSLEATAILLAEKEHFDDERKKTDQRKQERLRKRKRLSKHGNPSPAKRLPLSNMFPPQTSAVRADDSPSSGSDAEDPSQTLADLRARYVNKGETQGKFKRKKREIEPVMDDFINAGIRGLGCRCVPLNVYFENNKATLDSRTCDPTTATGECLRCSLPSSRLCCDIHNPSSFQFLEVPPAKPPRLPP